MDASEQPTYGELRNGKAKYFTETAAKLQPAHASSDAPGDRIE